MKEIIITEENVEELVGKLIDKRATSAENTAITKWRQEDIKNETHFQSILQVNDWFDKFQQQTIDVNAAWNNVRNSIQQQPSPPKDRNKLKIWRIAGIGLLTITLILLLWKFYPVKNSTSTPQIFASKQESREVRLDDGSQVQLYKNSGLSEIQGKARTYNFTGSGKFDVIHKSEEPFTIFIDEIIVKDLGTIFEIAAEPLNDTVFVQVTEGVVHFYTKEDYGIMLKEGEEGIYIKSKDQFFKRSINEAKSFLSSSFRDAKLEDLVDYLAYSFRKKILFENERLRNCGITVEFEEAPFSIVQEVLEETLNITLEVANNTLTIKGNDCNE